MSVEVGTRTAGGIGQRAIRPDGIAKVRGEFAFAGDLWAEGMLWGQALRSPHPASPAIAATTPRLTSVGIAEPSRHPSRERSCRLHLRGRAI